MESKNKADLDGYSFVCKLCGNDHEVPEEKVPYWSGGAYHLLVGQIELACAEKPGTALYSTSNFQPYRIVA